MEFRQLLRDAWKWTRRGNLNAAHEKIRLGIVRFEGGRLAEALRGIVVERACKERGSECGEYARGFWPGAGSLLKDIAGLPHGTVIKEFRAPGEIVLFARVGAHRLCKLVDGGYRIAERFVHQPGETVKSARVAVRREMA